MEIKNKLTVTRGEGGEAQGEKEGAYTLCNSMDGPGEHYAK